MCFWGITVKTTWHNIMCKIHQCTNERFREKQEFFSICLCRSLEFAGNLQLKIALLTCSCVRPSMLRDCSGAHRPVVLSEVWVTGEGGARGEYDTTQPSIPALRVAVNVQLSKLCTVLSHLRGVSCVPTKMVLSRGRTVEVNLILFSLSCCFTFKDRIEAADFHFMHKDLDHATNPLTICPSGWAHVVCALYIPEVQFANVLTMEPIILQYVPHERYIKVLSHTHTHTHTHTADWIKAVTHYEANSFFQGIIRVWCSVSNLQLS